MITTHALFAWKVQRKLRNGVAGFAAGGSSVDQRVRGRGMLAAGPELRITGAAAQTRKVSVARIPLVSRKSTRLFKGIICDDISEFESYMPSQPVGSPALLTTGDRRRMAEDRSKNQYYKKYNLIYGQLTLSDASSPLISRARDLHQTMSRRVEGVRKDKVIDTHIFDHLIEDLQTGFKLLCQLTPDDLANGGRS